MSSQKCVRKPSDGLRLASGWVGALALLWLGACNADGGGDATPDTGVALDVSDTGGDADPVTCADNTECRGGEICVAGGCRTACDEETLCAGALTLCNTNLGVCSQCAVDEDCAAAQACDLATGFCQDVTPECTRDRDCAGGFACVEGACTPLDPVICEAGTTRCDGQTLVTCLRDGTREEETACGEEALCVDQGDGAAVCAPIVCVPNAIGCADDATAFLCNADGTELLDLPCGDGAYCADGVCAPQACTPGPATCEGDTVVRCDAPGAERVIEACAETEVCAASELGCACDAGACTPRVCTPAAGRCVGNAGQICADDGLSWLPVQPCGDDGLCIGGACVPVLCTPGSIECAGEVLVTCGADGTTRAETDCAAEGQLCASDAEGARCSAPICTPGARTCASTGEAVSVCDARGAAVATTPCGASQFCQEGVCLDQVCTPGTADVCAAGDARRCDARGTGYDLVDACAAGTELCRDGACAPIVCTPSTQTCLGETVRTCSADGLTATSRDCTAEDAFCRLGECIPQVCDPSGPNLCLSGDVQRCNARGSAYTVVRDCGDNACVDGACDTSCGDGVVDAGEDCDDGAGNGPTGTCSAECTLNLDRLCDGQAWCQRVTLGGSAAAPVEFSFSERPLDLVLLFDRTPSMIAEHTDFRNRIADTLVPSWQTATADLRVAITDASTFPCDPWGTTADIPFGLRQRLTSRVADLVLGMGRIIDTNYLGVTMSEAMWQIATGRGRLEPSCGPTGFTQPAFDPSQNRVADVADGTIGGVGFREDSVRMVLMLHDSQGEARGDEGGLFDPAQTLGARRLEAEHALRSIGALGVSVRGNTTSSAPLGDANTLVVGTGTAVPACAWDGIRPTGCSAGQCCTGSAAGVLPDAAGLCLMRYATSGPMINRAVEGVQLAYDYGTWTFTLRVRWDDPAVAECVQASVTATSGSHPNTACGSQPSATSLRAPGAGDAMTGVRMGSALTYNLQVDNDCLNALAGARVLDGTVELVSSGGWVADAAPVRLIVDPGVCSTLSCVPNTCGNGVVEAGETCDDGNDDDTDGCTATCTYSTCGDGVLTLNRGERRIVAPVLSSPTGARGRVCDDGATCPGGTCDVSGLAAAPEHGICQALGYARAVRVEWGGGPGADASNPPLALHWSCFDGGCQRQTGDLGLDVACGAHEMLAAITCADQIEVCDEGNRNNNTLANRCRLSCLPPSCGDGVRDTGEQCDDGNGVDDDTCSNSCRTPICGDGIRQAEEECDDGVNNSNSRADACRTNCRLATCGDGTLDSEEQCDDGNRVEDDGCSNLCLRPSCGDGVVQVGEDCDDGNAYPNDGCNDDCYAPLCGNGVREGDEQCDDGNAVQTDGCRNDCSPGPTFGTCFDEVLPPMAATGDQVTGTTLERPDNYRSNCGNSAQAGDYAYLWTVPQSGTWEINTRGSDYDTVLHIGVADSGLCNTPTLACNDDGGGNSTSLLRRTFSEGDLVRVVVDGYVYTSGSGTRPPTGPYLLNFVFTGP